MFIGHLGPRSWCNRIINFTTLNANYWFLIPAAQSSRPRWLSGFIVDPDIISGFIVDPDILSKAIVHPDIIQGYSSSRLLSRVIVHPDILSRVYSSSSYIIQGYSSSSYIVQGYSSSSYIVQGYSSSMDILSKFIQLYYSRFSYYPNILSRVIVHHVILFKV